MKVVFFGMNADYSIMPFLAIVEKFDIVGVFELVDKKSVKQKFVHLVKKISGYKSTNAYSLEKSANVYGVNYFADILADDLLLLDWLKNLKPDLICVAGFSKKISREVLNVPTYGVINIHSGILPRFRGANPFFHMLRLEEKSGGVSVHWMNEKFDDGEIIKFKQFPLISGMNLSAYNSICGYMAAIELPDILDSIKKSGKSLFISNDASLALNCFSPGAKSLCIDKTWTVHRTLWLFNAFSDRYNFYVNVNGINSKVFAVGKKLSKENRKFELADGHIFIDL